MKCSKCKKEIPEGSKFCPHCATPVVVTEILPNNGDNDKWQKNFPLIGAGLGIICGFISLMGWFSPWTTLKFGNGPQFIILPFGLGAGANVLNDYPALRSVVQSADQITGWFLLTSIILAIISILLVGMCLASIWMGIKCLEDRSDVTMLPAVKNRINRIQSFSLTGIIVCGIVMVLVSVFQLGNSSIGGGLVAMVFGFVVAFLSVIYLKPHLR